MSEQQQGLVDALAIVGIAYVSYWLSIVPMAVPGIMMANSMVNREPWAFPTFLVLGWLSVGAIAGLLAFLLIRGRSGLPWTLTVGLITGTFLLQNNRFTGATFPGKIGEAVGRFLFSGLAAGVVVLVLSRRRLA